MSSNTPSAPEAGQTLAGKYLIEEVLGVGGMGVVVAAKHLQLDQKVAIKYLLPAALLNPEVVERFAREARAAAKIRGEHVARVIDVGQFDDGAPYMVMERLDGHDLAKHLELHGPLPIEDAVRFLLETCEALAEAHAAKIVHRDLKPSNMFLAKQPDKSAIIKVLDFGISKTGDAPSASLTKTSALMGTAYYMSPEQLTNPKGVDHRSDIWSLGVILFELLAGRQPFLGESVPEIIGGILSNQPEGLRTLRADVPVGLEAVIVKCMQSKTADRYQSVAGLAAALGPFAHMRDRLSIDITARVLGESVKPPQALPSTDGAKATVMMPSPNAQTGPTLPPLGQPPAASAPSAPPPSMQAGVDRAAAPAVAAVTTHGMSTSAITPKPKRSMMPLIAGAIVIVVAIGGTAAGVKLTSGGKADAPPAAATGLVAAPAAVEPQPHAAPTNANTGTTTILPAAAPGSAAPAPDPSPAIPAANAAAPRVNTANPAAIGANPGPRAPGAPGAPIAPIAAAPASAAPAKSATPVASAAPPVSAAPAASQVAAPNSSSKSNPLQMGIK